MKNLILCISLLALTSCGPSFKVGECGTLYPSQEKWETNDTILKVLEIGKERYRLEYVQPKHTIGYKTDNRIRSFDRVYEKTVCPKPDSDVEMNYEQ